MSSISSTTGASESVTITSKLQKLVFPAASVAVKLTVVVPTGNVSPEAGPLVCSKLTSPELSAISGSVKLIAAPHIPGSFCWFIVSGQTIVGSSLSSTVTVKLHSEVFPAASVAVKVMVVVPISNWDPETGPPVCSTVTSQLSVAVAFSKSTIA